MRSELAAPIISKFSFASFFPHKESIMSNRFPGPLKVQISSQSPQLYDGLFQQKWCRQMSSSICVDRKMDTSGCNCHRSNYDQFSNVLSCQLTSSKMPSILSSIFCSWHSIKTVRLQSWHCKPHIFFLFTTFIRIHWYTVPPTFPFTVWEDGFDYIVFFQMGILNMIQHFMHRY